MRAENVRGGARPIRRASSDLLSTLDALAICAIVGKGAGTGTGTSTFRAATSHPSIATCISPRASSHVSPCAMQPGNSGALATQISSSGSQLILTAYLPYSFLLMHVILSEKSPGSNRHPPATRPAHLLARAVGIMSRAGLPVWLSTLARKSFWLSVTRLSSVGVHHDKIGITINLSKI